MIISASRRTDIPAFYGDWFVNRLREGFVLVRNPMNYRQISKIILSKDVVDFIIFWTKNPADFLKNLKLIDQLSYPYYFLFTVNPYGKIFDANLPDLEFIISVFKKLSNQIGDNKVLWRYDPIIITPEFNEQFHFKTFEKICKSLTGYTSKCIISFITMYAKCVKNLKSFKIITPDGEAKIRILKKFYQIASSYKIELQTCAVDINISLTGILKGKCIDNHLIEEILGKKIKAKKDTGQRKNCYCIESIDIGVYNTCKHKCLYCYANYNFKKVDKTIKNHNPDSPLLIGNIEPGDKVYERKMYSCIDNSEYLFQNLELNV